MEFIAYMEIKYMKTRRKGKEGGKWKCTVVRFLHCEVIVFVEGKFDNLKIHIINSRIITKKHIY